MIRTIADQSVGNDLYGSAFERVVEQAVVSIVLEPYIVDAITTRTIDSPEFSAPAAMFVENEVQKCSPKQAKMDNRYRKVVKVVDDFKPSSSREGSSRSASSQTNTANEEKTKVSAYSDSR